jgi:tetratricopeptide (TPR) repeat protein
MRSRTLLILTFFAVSTAPGGFSNRDSAKYTASVTHYVLSARIDNERHYIQGEARFVIQCLHDSLAELHFIIPAPLEFYSVRDAMDKRYDRRLIDLPGGGVEVVVFLDSPVPAYSATVVRLLFEGEVDTTSTHPVFVGASEFLLTYSGDRTWWPQLIAPAPAPTAETELSILAASGMRVFADGRMDSSRQSEKLVRWTFTQDSTTALDHCFFTCGIVNVESSAVVSVDSTVTFRLHQSPAAMDPVLATRILYQLSDAFEFFSALTRQRPPGTFLDYVVVGNDDHLRDWLHTPELIFVPNSPAFSQDDSAALMTGEGNPWIHQLSHWYGFPVADSLRWMEEAWAGYLTHRYLLARTDSSFRRRERLGLLSQILDFYPTPPLAAAQEDLQAARGTYVLLMLEYLLGRDLFDSMMRSILAHRGGQPLRFSEFQIACEEAYGSPLDWFFRQWVLQTGYPELVMSSDVRQTNRGTYSVQITISQRGDLFTMPVDVVLFSNARPIARRLLVREQDQVFEFVVPTKPVRIELDPDYDVLRWIPKIRLLAHAMTAQKLIAGGHDLPSSEQEASLTLKLDPNNHAGWNGVAYFALAKTAVIRGDLKKAEELFRKASIMEAVEPAQIYPVISLVRLGNVLEMQSKREEALQLYQLALSSGERNPHLYAYAISEAQKYLQHKFITSEAFWYGFY